MDKHKELPKINFIINNSPNKIIKETNNNKIITNSQILIKIKIKIKFNNVFINYNFINFNLILRVLVKYLNASLDLRTYYSLIICA